MFPFDAFAIGMAKHAIHEMMRLQVAIRKHRDYQGDDRCWQDDEELYSILPEGYVPPARDSCVELANCQRYIACRHNPNTQYLSPQREIERLKRKALHWCLVSLFQDLTIIVLLWRLWS